MTEEEAEALVRVVSMELFECVSAYCEIKAYSSTGVLGASVIVSALLSIVASIMDEGAATPEWREDIIRQFAKRCGMCAEIGRLN